MKFNLEGLSAFCENALKECGVSEDHSRETAKVLVNADMRGIFSHGTVRMIGYVNCLLSGGVCPNACPKVIHEGPSFSLVDAAGGLGIPASLYAVEIARKKAVETGIGMVNVYNSHHHGACGYYSQSLAQSGLIGIAMSTGDIIMAAAGGASRAIGNNPFSYAVPAGKYRAICYDVAMSMVAAGKISIAAEENQSIPLGWLLDPKGNPTTDPKQYDLGGALVAFGGHKGYGLSIMVESLAGILSGAAMLEDIHAWNTEKGKSGNVGHMFVALNAAILNPQIDIAQRAEELVEGLASAPCAPGVERILYPGQLEHEREDKAKADGVELPEATLHALRQTAQRTGISFDLAEVRHENRK